MSYLIRRDLAKPRLILDKMCRLYRKFASYLRRVLCKTRLIFPRVNGPIVSLKRKDHILQAIYRKWPSVCLFIICKIRGEKQISTWNHSIGGYGTHGNGSQHCLKSRRKTENKVSFHINPFTYGNFAEKRDLKLVEGFWTLWCYKLTTKPFLQVVHFVAF